ncbi:MAG: leucyl/phenylalanyl-tRNA--protein transferase, partial [Dolichospermum sp.]
MVKLVARLRERKFLLFDAQMMNPHLSRFGAYNISNSEYHLLLKQALQLPCYLI